MEPGKRKILTWISTTLAKLAPAWLNGLTCLT